jgi:uncharacterized membrane protein YecN with MAPEG domain
MITYLPVTLTTAALLGVLFIVLAVRIIQQRFKSKISIGDGSGDKANDAGRALLVAVRCHGNLTEYAPLGLILLALLELAGGHAFVLYCLSAMLVLSRILHPIGMYKPAPNPFRIAGTLLGLSAIGSSALYAFILVFLTH